MTVTELLNTGEKIIRNCGFEVTNKIIVTDETTQFQYMALKTENQTGIPKATLKHFGRNVYKITFDEEDLKDIIKLKIINFVN